MMKFTYQHTCRKGVHAYIINKSPFASRTKNSKDGRTLIPFLGEGYYFWEEDIDAAHRWGKKHYDDDYSIVEFEDLLIAPDKILDFTNRRHLKYFNELIETYIEKRPESKKWRLGTWIEFFKKMKESKGEEYFRYQYYRAQQHFDLRNDDHQKKIYFSDSSPIIYTDLSPLRILCSVDKSNLDCKSKKIVY